MINVVLLLSLFSVLMIRSSLTMIAVHFKCRGGLYPRSSINRFPVPDDKVSWSVEFADYLPSNYTSPALNGKPYADPEIGAANFKPQWNHIDGLISRISYMGEYQIVNGFPQNPIGRTGICGRGILGRWGPNHAADPVVTRWKRDHKGAVVLDENAKPILQFIAVKRGDTGEWALPGGMVDPGEKVSTAAIREFQEEAMNSFEMSEDDKEAMKKMLGEFFSHGDVVYEGYIDDRRNTDNSWMESIAYNFHDDSGDVVGKLKLHAGDDAIGVQWVDVTPHLRLYASHELIVKQVFDKHVPEKS